VKVKLILPALEEATDPHFRPIKYSLFPPLGLMTLAAYLDPDDEVEICDEHVAITRTDDSPDIVAIQTYITSAHRAYELAALYRSRGSYVVLGGCGPPARGLRALRASRQATGTLRRGPLADRPAAPIRWPRGRVRRQRQRLEVQCGITGPWQVVGRNRVSFDEMTLQDLMYAMNMGLWVDVRLCLKTIPAALLGGGL
jgi:hypothetical protein